ncbi:MAG: hypothetical protein IK005_08060 [Paludibacteraceae bacterium]|nr:hypothetical protein [Paludibacteraceae bacterium]
MKRIKKSFILLSVAFAAYSNGYADFQKDFSIENLYTISSDTINGTAYSKINLENARYIEEAGNPNLPCLIYRFYIPFGQEATDIILEKKSSNQVLLDNVLYPSQEEGGTGIYNNPEFSNPNEKVYKSNSSYPEKNLFFTVERELGLINMVTVKVYPISYNPTKNGIDIANRFSILVKTSEGESKNNVRHNMHENYIHEYFENLKFSVNNPEMIEDSLEKVIIEHRQNESLRATAQNWQVPFYEYVVITKRDLIPSFNQLLTWKRQKGLNAGAVAIEDILNDLAAVGGDLVSGINDDAGKLRKYLRASKEAGIGKYVLLGGMGNIVPVRYGCGGKRNSSSWVENDWWENMGYLTSKIPSDFYYSNLDGNWNRDGDIYYGERYGDNIMASGNLEPLYVGRLLCKDGADVERWTRKQLIYEQNPGLGEYSYLGRVLITANNSNGGNTYIDYSTFKNSLPSFFFSDVIVSSPGANSTKAPSVIQSFNSRQYGLYCNSNHGGPLAFGIWQDNTGGKTRINSNILANDSYDEEDNVYDTHGNKMLFSSIVESNNGLNNLNNYDYPAIIYSYSCENMPFDDYWNFGRRNLGESFLCEYDRGGVAYLGNTRNGWVNKGPELGKYFMESIKGHPCRLGQLEYWSKILLRQLSISYDNIVHWTILTHNLAGCPETYFWKESPKKFGNITLSPDGRGNLWVNNVNFNNAIVCVSSANDGGVSYRRTSIISDSNKNPKFTNVPNDYVVVVTLDGYIPYIYHSNECIIQNETFTGTGTRNCDNIVAGAHVTTSKPQGSVTIKSGANVTLDAVNSTTLKGGFSVLEGGELKIK